MAPPTFCSRSNRSDDGPACVLQEFHPDGWLHLYSFTMEPEHPADYEMANYFMSTLPSSGMVLTLMAQIPGIDRRLMLRNRQFYRAYAGKRSVTKIPDDEAILAVLAERFDLHFPGRHSLRVRRVAAEGPPPRTPKK